MYCRINLNLELLFFQLFINTLSIGPTYTSVFQLEQNEESYRGVWAGRGNGEEGVDRGRGFFTPKRNE
jgi:hypothetical protein